MESVVDKELDLYVLNSESGSNRVLEGIDTENNLVKNLDSSNVEKILDKDLEVINKESSSDFFFCRWRFFFSQMPTMCFLQIVKPFVKFM